MILPLFCDITWIIDGVFPSGDRFRCWVMLLVDWSRR